MSERNVAAEVVGSNGEVKLNCTCGQMLTNGAFGGWYCGAHGDVSPHKYAVDAVRELHEKWLAAVNELHALKIRIGEA